MINKLIIGSKIVELETDVIYQAIELKYSGNLYINNLLPDDYIVNKGNGKVIIVRFNRKDEIIKELFEYDGYCNIYYGFLIDKELQKHKLIISKPSVVTWNSMNKKNYIDGTSKTTLWESLTTDYELMENNFRNDYVKSVLNTICIDPDTNVKTPFSFQLQKPSNRAKRDRNLSTIEKLSKVTGETIKKPKKTRKTIRSTY